MFDKILLLIERLHKVLVFNRRAATLSQMLSELISNGSKVLDVGCGNGHISNLITQIKPSVSIEGIEVKKRPDCLIDCKVFDGEQIPFKDSSVDVCMFVDVLHHTLHPEEMLKEARRVSSKYIVIKDHLCEDTKDLITLKFMDWIGNRPHGVNLVYNYLNKEQWGKYFSGLGFHTILWNDNIKLYHHPANFLFGRKLHFLAILEINGGKNQP